ncbi:hypothetical protein PR202_gb13819 [Eleusine coracana subsp. coracana]|uniref:PA domain-containing protein n=1 Tax=Eleusine coracana subsp. coracana TaxID=191504 RepID=A0AAV5ERA9_ELECO|nr:hypothetical protein PR202_gb13819 [Eleusine coracana subsp. coracana]
MAQLGAANVVLMGNNLTLSFDDIEANFAPGVKGTGVNGVAYTAEPLNACTPLTTKASKGPPSPFALIIRGGCPFDDKVRNVQDAGFKAAIVYDNENSGVLVSKFHAACVDLWLTSWRTFCPVCKRDARNGVSDIPASETTPLLSSAARLPSQSSSFRSSVAVSPPRAISRHPSTQSVSRAYSVSSTPYSPNPLRFYTNSPAIGVSRSNADLANMSSPHPRNSHISSTHSLVGSHLSPPISIRYSSPHISHSGYGSPSPHVSSSYISNSGYGSSSYYLGSSSQHRSYLRRCGESGPSLSMLGPQSPQQQSQLPHGESGTNLAVTSSAQSFRQSFLRHCGDSDASLSDMTSAQSLPGC